MDLWLIVHILSAIVAFGLGFAQPMLRRASPDLGPALLKYAMFVQAPAMVVLAGSGFALIGTSDGAISIADPWVSAAFVVWMGLCATIGISAFAERENPKWAPMLLGIQHSLLLISLYLMVAQPG